MLNYNVLQMSCKHCNLEHSAMFFDVESTFRNVDTTFTIMLQFYLSAEIL